MYTAYFGFRENPFTTAPDPRFVYVNRVYQEAYTSLLSGIRERKGFLLLAGEMGTGKTTLLRQLMSDLHDPSVFFDSTNSTNVTFEELLNFLCQELGLAQDERGRLRKLQAFNAYLIERLKEGGTAVLLIDEAQNLGDEVLGNLRLLSPFDPSSEKLLLQVVLVGQPELERKLAQPNLRQLKQRIALQCRLGCLEEREVGLFIHHRLRMVGGDRQDLFAPEAIRRVTVYSKGIPRLVNLICDDALLIAYGASGKTVSAATIDEVAYNLGILEQFKEARPFVREEGRRLQPPPEETARALSGVYLLSGFTLLILLTIGLLYYRRLALGPAVLQLPAITWADPALESAQEIVVAEGQRLTFAVEAVSPRPESLQYVWLLDGQEQGRGQRWTYQPQFDDGGPRRRQVTVQISDREGHTAERSWQVRVQDVNRPPFIAAASPEDESLAITAGDRQQFVALASDPDADDWLAYVWLLDEQEVARGQSWEFAPSATEAGSQHRITVTVSDKEGVKAEKKWTVTVVKVAPPLLVITRVTPVIQEPRVAEGQRLTFAVEAVSPRPESLQYVWLLDGQEQGRGQRWTYQPQFDDGGPRRRQVTVQISDREGHTAERSWQVRVQDVNRPPFIAAASPPVDTLEIAAGEEQSFSIDTTDPDKDDRLVSVWSLDGQEVARGQSWKFRVPSTSAATARYQVEAAVSDTGGLKDRFVWNIVVKMPAFPPPSIDIQPPDESVEIQARKSLVFSEVQAWLETHRQAWEEKNVDVLVELGVVPNHNADKVRQILAEYESFSVVLQNVDIRITGNRAEVSFSRIDTVDGRIISHPDRKVFIVEKGANDRLTAVPGTRKP